VSFLTSVLCTADSCSIIFIHEFASGPGRSPTATPKPPVKALPGVPSKGPVPLKSKDPHKMPFVPENVYDAMKENKRFDTMRVSGY